MIEHAQWRDGLNSSRWRRVSKVDAHHTMIWLILGATNQSAIPNKYLHEREDVLTLTIKVKINGSVQPVMPEILIENS